MHTRTKARHGGWIECKSKIIFKYRLLGVWKEVQKNSLRWNNGAVDYNIEQFVNTQRYEPHENEEGIKCSCTVWSHKRYEVTPTLFATTSSE